MSKNVKIRQYISMRRKHIVMDFNKLELVIQFEMQNEQVGIFQNILK